MTDSTATAPAPEQLMRRVAENYERWFVPQIGEPAARRVVDAAAVTSGERVLDLACGTGIAGRLVAETTAGTRVVGVDSNPGMIAVAAHASPDLDWHQGEATDLPVDDDSIDVVVCSQGLQFFADKQAALAEANRVLVPGGRVVVATPGPTPPLLAAIDEALADHVGPEASGFVHAVFSLHDPAEVTALLDDGGFIDVEIDVEPLALRVPQPVEFFWQYVQSTPLAMFAAGLDAAARNALERDVADRCADFTDADGATMTPDLLVATARTASG